MKNRRSQARAVATTRVITGVVLLTLLLATGATPTGAAPAGATSTGATSTGAASTGSPLTVAGAELDLLVDEFLARGGRGANPWSPTALRAAGQPDFSPARFDERIQPMRDLLARVEAVETEGLSLPERNDRRVMIAILESDIYNAERRREWEMQPTMYVPVRQVAGLFPQDSVDRSIDQERARLVLAAVPGALAQARANLGRPPERTTREAMFQTRTTIEALRRGLASLEGETASVGSRALAELESYLDFLENDLLPRSDGSWAIGKEHYDYTLRHRWLMEEDADDIIAIGRSAFEQTVAEAQEVAERISPGRHWVEVYEELKKDHPTADGLKTAYQEQMDAARAFVIENKILTLPAGEHVITVDTPPAQRRSSPFGTFDSVGPEDDDLQGRLVLTPIEEGLTPEQREARLSAHHTAWIPIIAVHEAYPGHHAQALKSYENPRKLRHYVRESIFSEGWGLFTEQLMFEEGFLHGDDVELTRLRNRLWRAARVILDASLHTGRMTFDEAVDFMVEEVRFDRIAAELEVGMYTGRPTYFLGYLIGMLKIEEMRREWIAKYGEPDEPRQLYDALLRIGSLPPSLVRAELLESAPATAAAGPATTMATRGRRAGELGVMSFNIRYGSANDGDNAWPLRRSAVVDVIDEFRPEVLGVQEALRFQLDEIAAALPRYREIGVGRTDGAEAGEYAAILVDRSRLDVLDEGTFWFSDTPHTPGSASWGNDIPRICTWARLRDRVSGSSFYVYNVHWDHRSQPSRERSAALLLEVIEAREFPDEPVVVTGDFNAGEANRAFTRLVGAPDGALADTFRRLHPQVGGVGTFNGFDGETSGEKIDAVLASSDWDVRSARIVRAAPGGRYPSDHFPVTAVLAPPAGASQRQGSVAGSVRQGETAPQSGQRSEAAAASSGQGVPAQVTILTTNAADIVGPGEPLQGEWSFAAWIEAGGRSFLFDTGWSPDNVLSNARSMGIDVSAAEDLVLSHNHIDHTGGLETLRTELSKRNPRALSRIHVAEGIFASRPGPDGAERNPMVDLRRRLEELGATFIVHSEPAEIGPGVWVTGPVPRPFDERNYPLVEGSVVIVDGESEPDIIPESQSLVIVAEGGPIFVSGCGHAGLINTLTYGRERIVDGSPQAAIGGFHLFNASEETLRWTAEKLAEARLGNLVGSHCTGFEAVVLLRQLAGMERGQALIGAIGTRFMAGSGIVPGSINR